MLILTVKKQDFVKIFVFGKLDSERERDRNQNFSQVGTGTATNHCGSTTLIN
jgi:hypothetical protein